jgi:hypothetical protein
MVHNSVANATYINRQNQSYFDQFQQKFRTNIRECIQKFPDWVDNEINNNNNNKHSLRSNTKYENYSILTFFLLTNVKSKAVSVHHAMKTYWESGGIAPHIIDLGTRWKWVVSFTSPAALPPRKSPWYPMDRWLGVPQSRFGHCG